PPGRGGSPMSSTRRREFITLLGGAAAWPLAARAQQGERMRHVGVLMPFRADDLPGRDRLATFVQALQQLGWIDGRNVRIDPRWGGGNAGNIHKFAAVARRRGGLAARSGRAAGVTDRQNWAP